MSYRRMEHGPSVRRRVESVDDIVRRTRAAQAAWREWSRGAAVPPGLDVRGYGIDGAERGTPDGLRCEYRIHDSQWVPRRGEPVHVIRVATTPERHPEHWAARAYVRREAERQLAAWLADDENHDATHPRRTQEGR